MIEALSGMFKYSVNYETEMVNINGELNYLSKYLQIQQLRFPNRFTYQELNSCTTDLLLLESCPRLILQPIVENSINHGFAKMRKGGCITVSLEIRNQDFYIIVEDNGCGIPQDKVIRLNESLTKSYLETELENDDRHSGIGLINTNRRIKIFCGEEYGLKVISAPQVGTQVEICLPLYEEAKNEY